MGEMISVNDIAKKWEISPTRVRVLCREGKIAGAIKQNKAWLIPCDAQKPLDARFRRNEVNTKNKLVLPIGISDYKVASTEYYYVDKTLLIKDFLDERPMVSLFTRPRRFGKTLTMDMIKTFFEKTNEDTSIYFKDKYIWQCGKKYQEYQGKYPVIFVTFKDIKFNSWNETFDVIKKVIGDEFSRHKELTISNKCNDYDKEFFKNVVEGKLASHLLASAFAVLSKMLHEHYEIAPIIIIDEYDIPIQQGYMCGYYDEIILFMRNLFSGGLKDNRHLSYGFLTGILRIAKESIFSGLNNLKINSILDDRYSKYFGFTKDEIINMAAYYDAIDKVEEICEWYNGYVFGKAKIFNPWSVINYFGNKCKPRAFWQSTGSNDIIGEILANADEEIYERLELLLAGENITTYIDTDVLYPQIMKNPSTIYSFLLVAGYLKADKTDITLNGDYMCRVSIPNKEIAAVYNKEILSRLDKYISTSIAISIQEALYSNEPMKLQKLLNKLLLQCVSCYDTAGENFYHGLLLGMCIMFEDKYIITSNRESGEGRYDIQLMPRFKENPGILIELKANKDCSDEQLMELANNALKQINVKKYDTEMRKNGVSIILKYGVAFSKKNVKIISEK